MIKHRIKRYLAGLMSFAMVVTMLPSVGVKAETTKETVIKASKFLASGGQSETDTWLIATNDDGNGGNETKAAYVAGETASRPNGGLGSSRMGVIAFELDPEGGYAPDPTAISKATVSMNVTSVNNNMGEAWSKLGLYLVDASKYEGLTNDQTTFPSAHGYSYDVTMYSNEKISKSDLGIKTFDVTDAVIETLKNGGVYSIFRIQSAASGMYISKSLDDVTLTIETAVMSDQEAVDKTLETLLLPERAARNLTLPAVGTCSANITWKSGSPDVIADDGTVTRPTDGTDVSVTMTATVSRGEVSQNKEFQVLVKAVSTDEDLLAEYEFTENDLSDGVIEDLSKNSNNASLKGSGAAIADGMLTLPGGNAGSDAAYVELPGSMFEKQDVLTITTWLKNQTGSGNYAAMSFGTPTKHLGGGTADMPKNYWILNPAQPDGYFKSVVTDGSDESEPYSKETVVSAEKTSADWGMYTTVITADEIIGYYNGREVSRDDKTMTTSEFGTGLTACIGRSGYNDKFYKGGVYGVRVYKRALTQQEIWNEYYDNVPAEISVSELYSRTKDSLKTMMLGENASADAVLKDLVFAESVNDISLQWTSDATDAIAADGRHVYTGQEEKNVKITVIGTRDDKEVLKDTYDLKVLASALAADCSLLEIPNASQIKGNLTLPAKGANGSSIKWKSSDPSVITDTVQQNEGYDSTPAGVVTRGSTDQRVTLTAELTAADSDESMEKTFELTVKAKAAEEEMTDYVFAYFVGNGTGEEAIYLATSRDGKTWEEINEGKIFLESGMGTKGLRDPYIFRSAEGDKFYLIATDLCIAKDGNWTTAQTAGSQAIMIWESDDLVHWSDQRMVTVSAEIEAGCTWAPEVFYDDKTGEYLLFWASKVKSDNYAKQRVYYSKTRDFRSFTTPEAWIDESHSTIDTTVVRAADGTYYRFTKNESKTYIYMEKAESLLGEWTVVNENIAGGVEGPCGFKLNDDDKGDSQSDIWYLLLDDFGGVGYYPLMTDDIASGNFTKVTDAKLPAKPRHGTVMNITAKEYQALMSEYGTPSLADGAIPAYVTTGYELPETADILFAGETEKLAVTWDQTAEDFAQPGTVKVTGKIPSMEDYPVSATVEVISEDLIYMIDSGVGEWNENLKESGMYHAISKIVDLRNQVPDGRYEEDGWGIVTANDAVGNRTSATDSVYTNGWWAKSGKDCEYILPLESGSYVATGYFAEWWSVTRPMQFFVEYKNDANETVTSEVQQIEVNKTSDKISTRLAFHVEGVEDTTEVHFIAKKATTQDPVIAGLAVEQVLDSEGRLEKALNAVKAVPEKAKLYLEDTLQMELVYPDNFDQKLEAAETEVSSIVYASSDDAVASVTEQGLIKAKKAGTADITATITLNNEKTKTVTTAVQCYVKDEAAIHAVQENLKKTTLTPESETVYLRKTTNVTVNYPEGFEAAVEAAGMEITSVVYESSDPAIAQVAEDGTVTAVAEGSADITAEITLSDGTKYTAKTTIQAKTDRTSFINALKRALKRVTISPAEQTLTEGETLELVLNYPSNLDTLLANAAMEIASVSYTSSKPETASVSDAGIVTAVTEGTAEITAAVTLSDDTAETFTAVIHVQKKASDSGNNTGGTDPNAGTTGGSDPNAGQNPTVNPGPDGGTGGTVTPPAEELTLTLPIKKAALGIKEKLTLKPKVTGNTAQSKVTYKSSNKKVASVSAKGVITAKKKGSATITAVIGNKKAKVSITVKPAPKKIALKAKSKTLRKGQSYKIGVKLPKGTASYKITYSSGNKKVASVSASGKVKALKKGKTTITVKTFNGKKAKLKITVR